MSIVKQEQSNDYTKEVEKVQESICDWIADNRASTGPTCE